MRVTLVAVGKLRDPDLRSAIAGYMRKLDHYVKLTVVETPDARRAREAPAVRAEEAGPILRALEDQAECVALSREGEARTSRELAKMLGEWQMTGRNAIFVIGGAFGLDSSVLDRCHRHLSLSSMTFPHELARLVLLEQLYRAGTILRGEPYHKGA